MALDDRRHPDAERLAEYADGVLTAEARAEVERHLADCAECRAVVTETMAFLEQHAAMGEGAAAPAVIPFRQRSRWIGVAAGLAAAAALVLAVRIARPEWAFGPPTDRPELQELIAAVANEPTRPVEGRLSGGFKYGPRPSPARGMGDREASPDVRVAAANIVKKFQDDQTAVGLAALGDAYLTIGDFERAIETLSAATTQDPQNAYFQNDLSAALLTRGRQLGRATDAAAALRAAETALNLLPTLVEARFNRALALSALGRDDEARAAWAAYVQSDRGTPWAAEAARDR